MPEWGEPTDGPHNTHEFWGRALAAVVVWLAAVVVVVATHPPVVCLASWVLQPETPHHSEEACWDEEEAWIRGA